jgi:putative PIN family toxin of toxin-antitoxin system
MLFTSFYKNSIIRNDKQAKVFLTMKRIVIDTNIVITALSSRNGASSLLIQKLYEAAKNNKMYNCVSVPSVIELEDVLFREENKWRYEQIDTSELHKFLNSFVLISNHINVHFLWRPFLQDAKDDMILELAVNGMADAIVTFNTKDFKGVYEKFGVKVLTPKELLDLEIVK